MDINKITKYWQGATIDQDGYMKKIVQDALQAAIIAEFDKFIGAKHYERAEERNGYRNGFYQRKLNTKVGSLTLNICRDRAGEFSPELFDAYQRSEKALIFGIAQMYFSGVSTPIL